MGYSSVALVLLPVEGEEQGQIVECWVGMCQKAIDNLFRYDEGDKGGCRSTEGS